jgi:hypothetical protein
MTEIQPKDKHLAEEARLAKNKHQRYDIPAGGEFLQLTRSWRGVSHPTPEGGGLEALAD